MLLTSPSFSSFQKASTCAESSFIRGTTLSICIIATAYQLDPLSANNSLSANKCFVCNDFIRTNLLYIDVITSLFYGNLTAIYIKLIHFYK